MRSKGIGLIVAGVAIAVVTAMFQARTRWQARTNAMQAEMLAARADVSGASFDTLELAGLPAPVARMFRVVLTPGQPLIATASVVHSGTFNMGSDRWRPFTSQQRVVARRPGFVWDARVAMAPGIRAYVHDAYVAGRGVLTAKLWGLVTVMSAHETEQLAQGELMRWFAEAAWYPTALLPSQGVQWSAIDSTHARATLVDGRTAITLTVGFDNEGRIATVRAEDRYRTTEDGDVPTPWQGRFWDYERRNGMWIPMSGEVAWILPEGAQPYWRGRITRLEYGFSR